MWPSSGGWRRVSVVPVTDPFLAGAAEPVLLDYPFTGRWMAKNSPARRVPSHGSHLFGTTYAVDFIAVDAFGRSASFGWRAAFGTEPPERFVGFGRRVSTVAVGDLLGECGNSGNSTQPHIHLQAMDSMVWDRVRGLPIRFHGVAGPELPGESQIVETHGMVG